MLGLGHGKRDCNARQRRSNDRAIGVPQNCASRAVTWCTEVFNGGTMASLLWLLFIVLLVLWLIGFAVNWGAFIWILLIGALVALVVNLVQGSRSGRWY
jgi:hypothetical protein